MFYRTTGCVLALTGLLVVVAGCPRGPSRIYPPSISGSAATDAIKEFDADKDGKLSGAELDKCPGLKAALPHIDRSGQKAITADDITARIQAWKESRLGRTQVVCSVLHNGRPLEGAEVKLVPEKFLGTDIKTGTGKTDQGGMAAITIPVKPTEPPGIAPGFYRVEITKPGLNIPAKYNTETTLGLEVAQDNPMMMEGNITFDLKF